MEMTTAPIRWIVSDMDGTLLSPNHEISPMTKEVLMDCQRRGIHLVLASGRCHTRLMRYAKELEMAKHGGYLIEVNGMGIIELETGKRQIFGRLRRDDIRDLFHSIKQHDLEFQGYQDDTVYNYIPDSLMQDKIAFRQERNLPEDYPWTSGDFELIVDLRDGYPNVHMIQDETLLPDELNKVGACHHPEVIEKILPVLKEEFKDRFEVVRTSRRAIEFTPKGISKGNALKELMKQHQLSENEIIVFGDGENDVSMFEAVKHSIAMGNALNGVKAKASDVTLGHDEDGVAIALKKYHV